MAILATVMYRRAEDVVKLPYIIQDKLLRRFGMTTPIPDRLYLLPNIILLRIAIIGAAILGIVALFER